MQGDINHINQHGSHPSGIGFVKKNHGFGSFCGSSKFDAYKYGYGPTAWKYVFLFFGFLTAT